MNVSDLTTLAPPYDQFFSNGDNKKLSLEPVDSNYHLDLRIYFDLFWALEKSRYPKLLGYTLTLPPTQNLGGGWRGIKLNDNKTIAHGTKDIW